jgi:hypothetical protein
MPMPSLALLIYLTCGLKQGRRTDAWAFNAYLQCSETQERSQGKLRNLDIGQMLPATPTNDLCEDSGGPALGSRVTAASLISPGLK